MDSLSQISSSMQNMTSSQSGVASASEGAILGKEDFLNLLVTQLKNQDPLDPTDPEDFSAQLAQFSSLEQLYNINDNISNMSNQFANSSYLDGYAAQMSGALSMLDKYIVLSGDSIEVQDDMESLEIGYLLDKSATEVNLTIKNENNETVCELHPEELSSGQHFITWDLKNTNGQDVAAGSYHLEVSAANGDETMKVQPLLKAQVNGVDGTSSDFSLITDIGDFNFNNVMRVLNS